MITATLTYTACDTDNIAAKIDELYLMHGRNLVNYSVASTDSLFNELTLFYTVVDESEAVKEI